MKLDPTSLRLFIAIVETGTIAAAAEREHIAAPAVSKRISQLEHALRTQLLSRNHKGVEPTAAGLALLSLARRAVSYLDDLHAQMLDYAGGARGLVRVFANISATTQFLPTDLASFLDRHPRVNVQLEERNSSVTVKAVAENAADVGIFTMFPHGESVETLAYEVDRLAVIVRNDHPLAKRERVRMAETLDWDFVGMRTGSSINSQLIKVATELDRQLRLRVQVTGYDALFRMVSAGLGIAVAPQNLTKLFVKRLDLTEIALDEDWAPRQLNICIRAAEGLPAAARLFVEHLQARAATRRPKASSDRPG
jgi:DNA-binding transcriptional LysR family regulator